MYNIYVIIILLMQLHIIK